MTDAEILGLNFAHEILNDDSWIANPETSLDPASFEGLQVSLAAPAIASPFHQDKNIVLSRSPDAPTNSPIMILLQYQDREADIYQVGKNGVLEKTSEVKFGNLSSLTHLILTNGTNRLVVTPQSPSHLEGGSARPH